MDLLLARYARKLLMKYRIHDIHYLSKVVLNKKIADVLRRGVKRTLSYDTASAITSASATATVAASSDSSPPRNTPPPVASSSLTPAPAPPQPLEPPSLQPSTPTASRSLFAFLSFSSPAPPETPDTDAPVAVPPIDTPPEPTEQATGDDRSDNGDAVAAEPESKKRSDPLRNIINSNDFGSALFALHLQFGVPFPQRYSPSPYFTLLSSLHAGLGEGGIAMGS
jgi:hypothetical protein